MGDQAQSVQDEIRELIESLAASNDAETQKVEVQEGLDDEQALPESEANEAFCLQCGKLLDDDSDLCSDCQVSEQEEAHSSAESQDASKSNQPTKIKSPIRGRLVLSGILLFSGLAGSFAVGKYTSSSRQGSENGQAASPIANVQIDAPLADATEVSGDSGKTLTSSTSGIDSDLAFVINIITNDEGIHQTLYPVPTDAEMVKAVRLAVAQGKAGVGGDDFDNELLKEFRNFKFDVPGLIIDNKLVVVAPRSLQHRGHGALLHKWLRSRRVGILRCETTDTAQG